jgi:hypothetical protein
MDTRLCYNSTDRLYEVRLGLRVLSSHPTKEQAELALLGGEAPKALELAQTLIAAHPELADRGIKAVALVAQGAVHPNGQAGHFEVRSQQKGKEEVYDVDVEASTCTCPDWEHRAPVVNDRKLCKHVLAALIQRKLGPLARKSPVRMEVIHDRP